MRILVLHPRMSIKGGGERVAIHSLNAALKAGHEVCLLSEEFDQAAAAFHDYRAREVREGEENRLAEEAIRKLLGE